MQKYEKACVGIIGWFAVCLNLYRLLPVYYKYLESVYTLGCSI